MKRKLEVWKKRVSKKCYDMFCNLTTFIADPCEEFDSASLQNVVSEHLKNLAERFELYFPEKDDPRNGNAWIRNPFMSINDNLTVAMEDKLLELAADQGLKIMFESNISLASFWIKVRAEYGELSKIALKCLLPFPSTYLCETGFSTMSVIKTKYRNGLDIRSPLRVALCNIEPRIDELTKKKQAHTSH